MEELIKEIRSDVKTLLVQVSLNSHRLCSLENQLSRKSERWEKVKLGLLTTGVGSICAAVVKFLVS